MRAFLALFTVALIFWALALFSTLRKGGRL